MWRQQRLREEEEEEGGGGRRESREMVLGSKSNKATWESLKAVMLRSDMQHGM